METLINDIGWILCFVAVMAMFVYMFIRDKKARKRQKELDRLLRRGEYDEEISEIIHDSNNIKESGVSMNKKMNILIGKLKEHPEGKFLSTNMPRNIKEYLLLRHRKI